MRQNYLKIAKKASFKTKFFKTNILIFLAKEEIICIKKSELFASLKQFIATEKENNLLHIALLEAQKKIEELKRRAAA